MKRIAILGCENSHASNFLSEIKESKDYADYEIVGVYSDEPDALKRVCEDFNVPALNNYSDAVGRIDGLVITARHGDNHYKYALPYIDSGIPMFIDKPITIDEDEALEFMRKLRENGVKVSGGSSLSHSDEVIALRESVLKCENGNTVGGVVRAPLSSASPYGGFYFYAAHLIEIVCTVFGKHPKSVQAFDKENEKTVLFRYDDYDITGVYCENMYHYYGVRFSENGFNGGEIKANNKWFKREFAEFDALLNDKEMKVGYDEFIYSVFVMNAVERSLKSRNEETVREYYV